MSMALVRQLMLYPTRSLTQASPSLLALSAPYPLLGACLDCRHRTL